MNRISDVVLELQNIRLLQSGRKSEHTDCSLTSSPANALNLARLFLVLTVTFISLATGSISVGATADELSPDIQWKVDRLSFAGNRALSEAELSKAMQTKSRPAYLFWQKRPDFGPETFKTDIARLQRLYQSEGYYHARIDYDLETKGHLVIAIIKIQEGPQIRTNRVEVRVTGRHPSAALIASVPLKRGAPFTEKEYQQGESILRGYFLDRGYGRATAERAAEIDTRANQARVFYSVEPGPLTFFGPTSIEGTRDIKPYIVARELVYKQGELFSPQKIADSRRKVLALQLFSAVEFLPDLQNKDRSVLPVTVKVTEKPPHDIKLGGGYGTQDEFRIEAAWANHNFLGDARIDFTGAVLDCPKRRRSETASAALSIVKSAIASRWQAFV